MLTQVPGNGSRFVIQAAGQGAVRGLRHHRHRPPGLPQEGSRLPGGPSPRLPRQTQRQAQVRPVGGEGAGLHPRDRRGQARGLRGVGAQQGELARRSRLPWCVRPGPVPGSERLLQ